MYNHSVDGIMSLATLFTSSELEEKAIHHFLKYLDENGVGFIAEFSSQGLRDLMDLMGLRGKELDKAFGEGQIDSHQLIPSQKNRIRKTVLSKMRETRTFEREG